MTYRNLHPAPSPNCNHGLLSCPVCDGESMTRLEKHGLHALADEWEQEADKKLESVSEQPSSSLDESERRHIHGQTLMLRRCADDLRKLIS